MVGKTKEDELNPPLSFHWISNAEFEATIIAILHGVVDSRRRKRQACHPIILEALGNTDEMQFIRMLMAQSLAAGVAGGEGAGDDPAVAMKYPAGAMKYPVDRMKYATRCCVIACRKERGPVWISYSQAG